MRVFTLPITRASFSVLMARNGIADSTLSPLTCLLPPLPQNCRRVYLIRHGETDWNNKGLMQGGGFDIKLNSQGKLQALAAQQELVGVNFDVIASSHLSRSEETANIISVNCPRATRIINHRFGEMRFGDFEGLPIRGAECTVETRERFDHCTNAMRDDLQLAWPGGGESTSDVVVRARLGLYQLLDDYPNARQFCIVAHGRFNRILLSSLLGVSEDEIGRQGNTGISVLDIDEKDQWHSRVINYVDHVQRDDDSAWK